MIYLIFLARFLALIFFSSSFDESRVEKNIFDDLIVRFFII